MSQHTESAEAMHVIECHSHQSAIDLRFPKLDRKVERSIQDGVEIVRTARELPEVFRLDAELGAELLFESDVELIAPGRSERLYACCAQRAIREAPSSGCAGEHEIFVVGRQKYSGI